MIVVYILVSLILQVLDPSLHFRDIQKVAHETLSRTGAQAELPSDFVRRLELHSGKMNFH